MQDKRNIKSKRLEGVPAVSKTFIAILMAIIVSFAAPAIVQAEQEKPSVQTQMPKPSNSGHASVNGLNYYYAIYGSGEPLLLLHGGLFHTEMFGLTLIKLAQHRQVIGVDLQAM